MKSFKEMLNEGGISYDTIASKIHQKLGSKPGRNWIDDAKKEIRKYMLNDEEADEVLQILASEDYYDTGDIFIGNESSRYLTFSQVRNMRSA